MGRKAFVVLVLVALVSLVPPVAAQEIAPHDMEPRAWAPLVASSYRHPEWRLSTPQAVVQQGAPVTLEAYVTSNALTSWGGRFVWGPSFQLLDWWYEPGLPVWLTINVEPEIHEQWGVWGQRTAWAVPAEGASVLTLVLLPRYEEFLSVLSDATFDEFEGESRLVDDMTYYSMACVFDWDSDNDRDLVDMLMLLDHVGTCNPLFDVDGDGVVTEMDYAIAQMWWGVPCSSRRYDVRRYGP